MGKRTKRWTLHRKFKNILDKSLTRGLPKNIPKYIILTTPSLSAEHKDDFFLLSLQWKTNIRKQLEIIKYAIILSRSLVLVQLQGIEMLALIYLSRRISLLHIFLSCIYLCIRGVKKTINIIFYMFVSEQDIVRM